MASIGFPSVVLPPQGVVAVVGHDGGLSVVWLHGEHDIATRDTLAEVIWREAAQARGDLILDLSGVEFMSAATVGVILRAREWLAQQSRSLALRSPSIRARRVLELCGVDCAT